MAGGSSKLERAQFLVHTGEYERARLAVARLLERSPGDVELNAAMAHVLTLMSRRAQAAHFARRALAARPDDAELMIRLGTLLNETGGAEEAAGMLARAASLAPGDVRAHNNLVFALLSLRRFAEAAERCRAGLERMPDEPQLVVKLGAALLGCGRAEEAVAALSEAAERLPESALVAKALASALNYAPEGAPGRVFAAHVEFGRRLEREGGAAAERSAFRNARDPERRLRVAIVSADLRRHSVAHFALPILRHLDRDGFEVVCWNTGGPGDDESARLRALSDGWRDDAWSLGPAELARAIEADATDVVVELSGLSHAERLDALRLRPAPVQASAIGYPNTTGASAIGWRIVDSTTDPPGSSDALAVERLLRVDPCFLCYAPPAAAVLAEADRERDALERGRTGGGVVFGSFNALAKLNRKTAALWARVLREAPGSRLVLKAGGLREERTRDEIVRRFEVEGVEAGRIEALPMTPGFAAHLGAYGRIDVALDTFPYHGTTTTCEALLMGTPVVSLAGEAHAARVGLSLLTNVGEGALCATAEDEFVRIGLDLAADAERRAGLRAGLRERMLASTLCDGAAYGARFGAALRTAWRAWCEGAA